MNTQVTKIKNKNTKKAARKSELAPMHPGWLQKKLSDCISDNDLKKLFCFYVINTPYTKLSYCGIELKEYGWGKDIWKNDKLKNCLFEVAGLKRNITFATTDKTEKISELCEKTFLKKGFNRNREQERIFSYRGKDNEFMSIFRHLRNAFAHGRFAIYDIDNGADAMFVVEDGFKYNGAICVRARMVLKKSTLLNWIEILQSGKYPEDIKEKSKNNKIELN